MPKTYLLPMAHAMTSAACQNPSLTYMALTARAADYAVEALKKGRNLISITYINHTYD
jgi:choline dehydrogenase-like flavoprotein